MMIMTS